MYPSPSGDESRDLTSAPSQAVANDTQLFKQLVNTWEFEPGPNPSTTWLHFHVQFQFRSALYAQASSLFLNEVVHRMVHAFETRAGFVQHMQQQAAAKSAAPAAASLGTTAAAGSARGSSSSAGQAAGVSRGGMSVQGGHMGAHAHRHMGTASLQPAGGGGSQPAPPHISIPTVRQSALAAAGALSPWAAAYIAQAHDRAHVSYAMPSPAADGAWRGMVGSQLGHSAEMGTGSNGQNKEPERVILPPRRTFW